MLQQTTDNSQKELKQKIRFIDETESESEEEKIINKENDQDQDNKMKKNYYTEKETKIIAEFEKELDKEKELKKEIDFEKQKEKKLNQIGFLQKQKPLKKKNLSKGNHHTNKQEPKSDQNNYVSFPKNISERGWKMVQGVERGRGRGREEEKEKDWERQKERKRKINWETKWKIETKKEQKGEVESGGFIENKDKKKEKEKGKEKEKEKKKKKDKKKKINEKYQESEDRWKNFKKKKKQHFEMLRKKHLKFNKTPYQIVHEFCKYKRFKAPIVKFGAGAYGFICYITLPHLSQAYIGNEKGSKSQAKHHTARIILKELEINLTQWGGGTD
ncbi:hypothetical protein M0812_22683 [Anaeramoeba flamelloides]|uniref:Uncharacterized protein n=1 Tax=Anaeramoeba flamelloides TaxID=1746091 RepID=A0AAV7YY46_9EUKA|nr:hypothetical protein M0812_22683 [Anaeramoeba flamelloides]